MNARTYTLDVLEMLYLLRVFPHRSEDAREIVCIKWKIISYESFPSLTERVSITGSPRYRNADYMRNKIMKNEIVEFLLSSALILSVRM